MIGLPGPGHAPRRWEVCCDPVHNGNGNKGTNWQPLDEQTCAVLTSAYTDNPHNKVCVPFDTLSLTCAFDLCL